jgi:hypothetical protein
METVTVSEFMQKNGITAKVEYVRSGNDIAPWTDDKPWECDQWKVTFQKDVKIEGLRLFSVDYWTGSGQRQLLNAKQLENIGRNTVWFRDNARYQRVPPTAEGVMDTLVSDSYALGQTFEDWVGDLGYDVDSRRAEKTFNACIHQTSRLLKFLGSNAKLEELRETERI